MTNKQGYEQGYERGYDAGPMGAAEGKNSKIKNKVYIEVDTCGKKHVFESNEVEADKVELIIVEEQNCNTVFEGEEICYKARVFNNSFVCLKGLEFKEIIPYGTLFDKNSFRVNGRKECPEINGRTVSYRLAELKEKCAVEFTFELKVL